MPWRGLTSSAAAPALLVGGWTEAARAQPQPVDPVADTISALAAVSAADRWVMMMLLFLLACFGAEVITGLGHASSGQAPSGA